ncbi:MAG TPA: glycosyltransferase family 2 protein [Ohtaekwangia sp.]|uniref:glycosyltransferase family 2 protein n=1 Tax=Ohtaekwangia sp. TaxID=2066019 RepID=UPI002F94D5CD
MAPLLSICIPTYNRSAYLKKCIRSVISYPGNDIEIIISDNASTDNTPEVVGDFHDKRIVYSRNPENVGPVANFYKILKAASGDYIFLLTDDDFLFPDSIDEVIEFVKANGNIDSFKSDLIFYTEKSKSAFNYSYLKETQVLASGNVEDRARLWQSAHVLTGCCFKREKIPAKFFEDEKFLWYPTMFLMGLLSEKQGYIAKPLAVHTWENELFWGIKEEGKETILMESIIDTLYLMKEYGQSEEQICACARFLAEGVLKKNGGNPAVLPARLTALLSDSDVRFLVKKTKASIKKRMKLFAKKMFRL